MSSSGMDHRARETPSSPIRKSSHDRSRNPSPRTQRRDGVTDSPHRARSGERERDRSYRSEGSSASSRVPEDVITPEDLSERIVKTKVTLAEEDIRKFIQRDLQYYKQLERDEYIAFASQIHPRVNERAIFEFFSPYGRICDIKLVRDGRTGKSKGLAYIEFEHKASAEKACAASGRNLSDYPVTVEPTANARTRNNVLMRERERLMSMPRRVTVTGLSFFTQQADVKLMCAPVCDVEHVDVVRTSATEAVAFIECASAAAASSLRHVLHGLSLAGRTLEAVAGTVKPTVLKHEYDYQPIVTAETNDSEIALSGMGLTSNLPAAIAPAVIPGSAPLAPAAPLPPAAAAAQHQSYSQVSSLLAATHASPQDPQLPALILSNLLDPKLVDDIDREDIFADVIEEMSKFGRVLQASLEKNGNMFLLLDSYEKAVKAQKVFHTRWYDDRKLSCVFTKAPMLRKKFPQWNI